MEDSVLMDIVTKYLSEAQPQNEILIANPERMNSFYEAHEIAKSLAKSARVNVKVELGRPCKTAGFIRISGKNITVKEPESFTKMCRLATNVDSYIKNDKEIYLELTFHHLFQRRS